MEIVKEEELECGCVGRHGRDCEHYESIESMMDDDSE